MESLMGLIAVVVVFGSAALLFKHRVKVAIWLNLPELADNLPSSRKVALERYIQRKEWNVTKKQWEIDDCKAELATITAKEPKTETGD